MVVLEYGHHLVDWHKHVEPSFFMDSSWIVVMALTLSHYNAVRALVRDAQLLLICNHCSSRAFSLACVASEEASKKRFRVDA